MYKVFGRREKGQYYNREGAYLITFPGTGPRWSARREDIFFLEEGSREMKAMKNAYEENVWRNADTAVLRRCW